MPPRQEPIDEYILAEYLAGDLSPKERNSVSAYLAGDMGARELLSMAGEAMDAAETSGPDSVRRGNRRLTRRPDSELRSLQWLVRLTILLCVLTTSFGATLIVHLVQNVFPHRGANDVPSIEIEWTPILRSDHFSVSWSVVEGAEAYVVIIMDPTSERLIARLETDATSIGDLFSRPNNEGALPTHAIPRSGEILDIWVSAFDARGNLLRRSDRIPFVAES